MTNEKRIAINELAQSIRNAFSIKTPVDLNSVVSSLKGKLIPITFEDSSISGRIQKKENFFEISYNSEEPQNRINFTIAHEIGHLFLHMGYIINPQKWDSIDEYYDSPKYRQGYSEEEYEANEFAGAFLMPESEYREFINNNSVEGRINISKIADNFEVSEDAALIRGKWLGIFAW